ncbi:succinate dehydrogenase, hydrophobic membrane anchor protein [Rickettsiella endosymbiont of Dermanyssus gallinae]|uniref:succinate dehydrogenase, hydrophobic membrane anchor protein n=1 Tax=Rickettsiella endosymbiont of Dermanyssus gallinae TaxID=2856608 RepID=UPI001C53251D|nr:succinate dehydrogenase, hydrophobic membrane anchor protein [Rickettsiella endosymbiont of Dermanyssus gallinae]
MVKKLTNVTSLSGNGLRDWLIQRVTSVVLLFYIVFLLGFFVAHSSLNYAQWHGLFNHTAMRLLSTLFLLSLLWHAWIGMWTIVTDYIKPFALRLSVQILIIIGLLLCFIWGLAIFWGN